MQDAIHSLRVDIGKMDVQVGVLQHTLAARQRQRMMAQHGGWRGAGPGGPSDEEEG